MNVSNGGGRRPSTRIGQRARREFAHLAARIIALAASGRSARNICEALSLKPDETERLMKQLADQIRFATNMRGKVRDQYIEGVVYGILTGA